MPFSNPASVDRPPNSISPSTVTKRLFDITIAAAAILMLMPVILLVAVAVAVFLGRPVLFVQPRPGFKGHPFILLKFRTMRDAHDAEGQPLPDAQRLNRFGRWLRKTSLDELPELWNVIRGDMSLVGPRPLLMEYLSRYTPEQMRRHDVLPGITGWAQVNGRNRLNWEDKFALDTWYVDNRSLWLDIKILALTVMAVFRADDVAQDGHATMEKFKGKE